MAGEQEKVRHDNPPRHSEEAEMTLRNGGGRDLRRAAALVSVAAVTAATAACGVVHVNFGNGKSGGAAVAGSAAFRADVAFAHCMQTHGMPSFPVPTSTNERISVNVSGHLNGNANGNVKADSPATRAYADCKQLLPPSSANRPGAGIVTQAQLDLVLKIVQCMRTHGEPAMPDPTVVGGSLHISLQPAVVASAQFQDAVHACRSLIPKGVQFP
jgi:hypothetical protein